MAAGNSFTAGCNPGSKKKKKETEGFENLMSKSYLTNEQRLEIYELYKAGVRTATIKARFGITRQTLYNAISKAILLNQGCGRRLSKDIEQSPYVNLKNYLKNPSNPTPTKLCLYVFGGTDTTKLNRLMRGTEQSSLTIGNIFRMEQLTGMPFDVIFYREPVKEDDHDHSTV